MPHIHGTEQTHPPFVDATAGAAIEKYRFSKYDTDGLTIIMCSVAGEAATAGVSRDKVTAAKDQVSLARYPDIAYVEFGGVVSPLGEVATSNVGKAVAAGTAGHRRLGRYLGTVNTADGVIGPVLLYPEMPSEDVVAAAAIANLTDNSGGTADSTLEDCNNAVAGVDGTGSNAASKADVDARLVSIANNFADLAAKVNLLLAANRASGAIAP